MLHFGDQLIIIHPTRTTIKYIKIGLEKRRITEPWRSVQEMACIEHSTEQGSQRARVLTRLRIIIKVTKSK